jgi:hypothetical protein
MAVPTAGLGAVTCIYADPIEGAVWTGHSAGYVRVRPATEGPIEANTRWLGHWGSEHKGEAGWGWQAFNKSPVTAITVTPAGVLWAGSLNGQVRIFELLDKARGSPATGAANSGYAASRRIHVHPEEAAVELGSAVPLPRGSIYDDPDPAAVGVAEVPRGGKTKAHWEVNASPTSVT